MSIKLFSPKTLPTLETDLLIVAKARQLEINSEYMAETGLPTLLTPMWHAITMRAIRAQHGTTEPGFDIKRLIGVHYGEKALELFLGVLQIKNAIRLMEDMQ